METKEYTEGARSKRRGVNRYKSNKYKKEPIVWRSMTTPMPPKLFTKVRYQENVTVEPLGSGVAGVYVFSANGLYDPNITGTGHQPRGFDEIMGLYDHYVVLGAKITCSFLNDTDALYGVKVGVALRDNSATEANPNDYLEQGYVQSALLSRNGGYPTVVRSFCSTRRFLGRSRPMSDPELKGTNSSNPTEQAYFHVFAAPINSIDAQTVLIDVRIDYSVAFIEPADITQS